MWKIVLAATGGLAVGGAAGWFFTKRHYENLVETRITAELKRFYDLRDARMAADAEKNEDDVEKPEEAEEFDIDRNTYQYLTEPYIPEMVEKIRYSKAWNGDVRDAKTAPPSPNEPFLIDEEAWGVGVPGYGSESLSYYLDGDLLINDESEVLDIDEFIGQHSLEEFRHFETQDDIIFVRNPKLGMDYEVSLSRGRYYVEDDE